MSSAHYERVDPVLRSGYPTPSHGNRRPRPALIVGLEAPSITAQFGPASRPGRQAACVRASVARALRIAHARRPRPAARHSAARAEWATPCSGERAVGRCSRSADSRRWPPLARQGPRLPTDRLSEGAAACGRCMSSSETSYAECPRLVDATAVWDRPRPRSSGRVNRCGA